MQKFSLAIIGAGPGGYSAAIQAAQQGIKVILIEEKFVGGVCLNEGCIPTKNLLSHAALLKKMQQSQKFQITADNISFDFQKIIEQKNHTVLQLRKNLENLILANQITLIYGKAHFIDEHTIEIKGNETQQIYADKIIIATGSSILSLPNIAYDHQEIFHSTSILQVEKLFSSLVIIGGGYIGCEFATFFSAFGVNVTIVEEQPTILSATPSLLRKELVKIFQKQNISVLTNTKIQTIDKKATSILLTTAEGKTIETEKILVAIGRSSNTEQLKLPDNIQTNAKGFIKINEHMQTSVDHIYAIGDVTGKALLAHVATHQAMVAIDHICQKEKRMHYDQIPSVIFTNPEIASVGISEEKAQEKNIAILIGNYPFKALGKAIACKETEGIAQVIAEKDTHRIIGAHIIGYQASYLITEMALAITNNLTLENIIQTIHPHPTSSEIWMEACLMALQKPLHFPPTHKKI